MSKTTVEDTKTITTSFLKKHKYFEDNSYKNGTITWTRKSMWGENKSSISIVVSTYTNDKHIRLIYTQTDNNTGEKKDFNYQMPLTTTPCRYGGKRYWFICTAIKNGNTCKRRVGTLYKDGDYFACRHCNELTYDSRNISGKAKAFGRVISYPELDEDYYKIKRFKYKGKITKRYARYLNKSHKADNDFIGMVELLTKGRRHRRK